MSDIVTLKIDGKNIRAKSGDNLLEVALKYNILIPNLCYHRKLTPTGACRLCITKIEGMGGAGCLLYSECCGRNAGNGL